MKAEVLVPQSCPTLCNPMDCNLSGSSVHGILQAACGILVFLSAMELRPAAVKAPSRDHWTTTEFPEYIIFKFLKEKTVSPEGFTKTLCRKVLPNFSWYFSRVQHYHDIKTR